MKVFISWSKPLSKRIAEALSDWLKYFPLSIEPWVSGPDIDPGSRWNKELSEALQDTNLGILCITKNNQKSPWICFEAGALAKTIEKSHVIPYLVNITPDLLEHPLKQFQAIEANKIGTLNLLKILFKLTKNSNLSENNLIRAFEKWWPDLENDIEAAKNEVSEPNIIQKQLSLEDIKNTLDITVELLESLSWRATKWESLIEDRVKTKNIRIIAKDRPRLLSDLTLVLISSGVNITRASIETTPRQRAIVDFTIQVISDQHLGLVKAAIKRSKEVISVQTLKD